MYIYIYIYTHRERYTHTYIGATQRDPTPRSQI